VNRASINSTPTRCFDICRRRCVTVARGGRPDERLLVAAGTPLSDVVARLNLAAVEEQGVSS
jgi:hypothetical protein